MRVRLAEKCSTDRLTKHNPLNLSKSSVNYRCYHKFISVLIMLIHVQLLHYLFP